MSDVSNFSEDPHATTQAFRSRGLPPDSDSPEGVLGRYELLHKLGEGGFGRVYKARDTATGDIVAIKILSFVIANHADALERLKRGIRRHKGS